MALDDQVKVFHVSVGPDKIRVAGHTPCLIKDDKLQRRTIQLLVDMLRRGRLKEEEDFKVLGANLYTVLLDNEIGEAITDTLIEENGPQLVRVELEFEAEQEILASWPWEYLYCPGVHGRVSDYFLARTLKLVVTRVLTLNRGRKLNISKPPLKILLVASGPKDRKVEYDKVLEEISKLGDGMIKVTCLRPDGVPKATWDNFHTALLNEEFDAVHVLGHGKWDSQRNTGTILFMNSDDTEDPRTESDLAGRLIDAEKVKLVFLQACESAQTDPYQAFSGVAQQLAQKGIPAVVGFQTEIVQQVANQFASAFYDALAKRLTVDAAFQHARSAIGKVSNPAYRLTFGQPVLYLRESGYMFAPAEPARSGPTGPQAAVPTTTSLPEYFVCPWCGLRNVSTDNFCASCDGQVVCFKRPDGSICKTRVDKSRLTCGECGGPLRQPRTAVVAASDEFARKAPSISNVGRPVS